MYIPTLYCVVFASNFPNRSRCLSFRFTNRFIVSINKQFRCQVFGIRTIVRSLALLFLPYKFEGKKVPAQIASTYFRGGGGDIDSREREREKKAHPATSSYSTHIGMYRTGLYENYF